MVCYYIYKKEDLEENMPDFTTHYLFGEYIKEKVDNKIKYKIDAYPQEFNWGLQGPDFLFYSKFYRDTGKTARCGSALHRVDPELLFSAISEYLIESQSEECYPQLLSYFYGFICHYILDSTIHPYVYYLIYEIDEQILKSHHILIENEIGSLMLKHMGRSINDFELSDYYEPNGNFVDPIANLYVFLIKKLFDKTVNEREIKSGFSICLTVNRLAYLLQRSDYDSKAKQALIQSAMTLVKKSELISSFIKKDHITRDTLNLKHKEWFNINYPDDIFTYSIPDLFENARKEVLNVYDKCNEMLKSKNYTSFGFYKTFDYGEPIESREKLKDRA